jgi:prephenate dehydratase
MELFKTNNIKLIGEYKNIGNSLMTGRKQDTELSIKISQSLIGNLQQCIKALAEIKQEVSYIKEGQNNIAFNNNANSEDLADFSSLFSN